MNTDTGVPLFLVYSGNLLLRQRQRIIAQSMKKEEKMKVADLNTKRPGSGKVHWSMTLKSLGDLRRYL